MEFYCSRNRARNKIRLFIVIILIDGCFVSCRSQSIDPNQNVNLIFTLHSVWSDSAKKNGEKEPNLHEIYSDLIGTTSQFAHSFQHFSFELRITFVVNSFLLLCCWCSRSLVACFDVFHFVEKFRKVLIFDLVKQASRWRRKREEKEPTVWGKRMKRDRWRIETREKRSNLKPKALLAFIRLSVYVCAIFFLLCALYFMFAVFPCVSTSSLPWIWLELKCIISLFFSVCVCLSLFHRSAILRLLLLLCFTLTGFLLKCTAQWSRMISVFLQFVFLLLFLFSCIKCYVFYLLFALSLLTIFFMYLTRNHTRLGHHQ